MDDEAAGRRAWQALLALAPVDRDLVALVVVDGLTPTQAANALGMRPGTARVRLHRRLRQLRVALAESETRRGSAHPPTVFQPDRRSTTDEHV